MSARVGIVGGGIAGLACACELADAGFDVVVLEAASSLGGRARSFIDRRSGAVIDNSQHVLLGCCTEAARFLSTIGSIRDVDFHTTLTFTGAEGPKLVIRSSALPSPFHLLPSIITTRYLSSGQKLQLSRALSRMARKAPRKEQTAGDYLSSLGCTDAVIKRLIEPILVSALNESLDEASARYARMVLLETLLGGRHGYEMGVPRVPLSQLIAEPAAAYLRDRGCQIRLRAKVRSVEMEGQRVRRVRLISGEELEVDTCVLAVSPASLTEMGLPAWGGEHLDWRPIVSAHLFFDHPVPPFGHTCVVDEMFQWVFDKSDRQAGSFAYVQAVASGAGPLLGLPRDEIIRTAMRSVAKAAPDLNDMQPKRAIIYRARRATFSSGAGSETFRPSAAAPGGNLRLAGDWTDTSWPATIESAVRSGQAAARAVIHTS